jgi:putative ABC transport system permease protein
MRALWRLAISSVSRRRSRSALLIAVVAMSAILISAVGVAMGSVRAALEKRVTQMVGSADVRITPRSATKLLDAALVERVRAWEGVKLVAPRVETSLSLRFVKPVWKQLDGSGPFVRESELYQVTTRATGFDAQDEASLRPLDLVAGRMPTGDREIVIDLSLAQRLSDRGATQLMGGQLGFALFAKGTGEIGKADPGPERVTAKAEADRLTLASVPGVGDRVDAVRFGKDPASLTIVGVVKPPPLGGSSWAYMTVEGVRALSASNAEGYSRIEVVLREGADANALVDRHAPELEKVAKIESTERITSGMERSQQANQLGFTIATLMSFIGAGFIIMTGMSTAITERLRELAILRCIGARPWQLATSQLLSGGIIGGIGAAIGVPIGVGCAYVMLWHYQEKLQSPPIILWERVAIAIVGAVVCGLVGAALPALQAARVSPLEALASRAKLPRVRTLVLISAAGLVGVLIHLSIFTLLRDATTIFFLYVAVGLPALMLGYFCLGVPAVLLMGRVVSPLLERVMRLPRHLLSRSVKTTPYRFGFTSSAMMAGLALMVAIWTQGGAATRDWLDRIRFPDAFVVGLNMPPEAQDAVRQLPFVTDTCAISLQPVETTAFGIRGLTKVKTFFVAYEPEPFFRMSTITWVQGDPATAIRRLSEGGSVIVSKEFLVARKLGVGGVFTCWDDAGREHSFEIVGVVESPGLEVANNFFDVGEGFTEQRVHAVFGSRLDQQQKFGSQAIGLLQLSLSPTIADDEAIQKIRETMLPFGALNVGSGRQIKETIGGFVRTMLLVSSLVAIFAMVVAGFGVANLIIAGVHARQFEFGVLRAVGAQRGLLARLVLAEVLIVAFAACVLGTLMGLQGAFGGTRLNATIWGLDLAIRPPIGPIAAGWGFVVVLCVGAAAPTAIALVRRPVRELLSAMRG